MRVGRDPSSDIWVGAPHISREQCKIVLDHDGTVRVTDGSKNGISYEEGILRRGETMELNDQPRVLDFGAGITLAICFNEGEEQKFSDERGAPHTFLTAKTPRGGLIGEVVKRATNHTGLNLEQIQKVNRRVMYSFVSGYRSLPMASKVGVTLLLISSSVVLILLALLLLKQII